MKDKSKEELKKELHDLQQKYDSLNAFLDSGTSKREHTENEPFQKPVYLDVISSIAKVGGWGFDTDTLKQTWTEEVYRIHELDFSFDPNVQNGISFYAPESRPVIEKAVQRAIAFGEDFDLELEFITHKGNHKWVHSIGKAFQNNGEIKKIYGSFQDITKHKQAELDLKKIYELNNLFLKYSPIYAFIKEVAQHESRVLMASENYIDMIGIPGSEMAGKTMGELFPLEFALKMTADDWAVVCSGKVLKLDEDMNGRHYTTIKFPIVLDDRTLLAGYTIDITDRKLAEQEIALKNEELIRLNAEKDKFFSIIAHDLRSPFSGFLGLTELMSEGLDRIELREIQKIVHLMKNSAANLFRLLGNLLEWSGMQRGLTTFAPESFLLLPKVTDCIILAGETANKKQITIRIDIPDDLSVYADENMFNCIIRNLMNNAVKFTRNGGDVSVSASRTEGNKVKIIVNDTGIGMSPLLVKGLFCLDFNSNRKGTDGELSTGLGLMLCKDFIEKQGGKLGIESEEGKGSCISFTIPENRG